MERSLAPHFARDQKLLLDSINLKYNYDFRNYAPSSMTRTLVLAMDRMGCPSLSALHEKVIKNQESFYDLVESLTVPVSEMFRDPSYYLALREKVIPLLGTYPSLKIWVAGCSTGEEVYSLAILLHEEGLLERSTLYATDINPRGLKKAEKGTLALGSLPEFRLNYEKSGGKLTPEHYFKAGPTSFTFESFLQKKITFADHSLVTDAVFSETQLISCRNVLIYFDRELQNKVFGLFRESLCRKGFLGLGSQETMEFSQHAKHFDSLVKKSRIYQKK